MAAMAMQLFERAFEDWTNPKIQPQGDWDQRDHDERRRDRHFRWRYWRLAMHPNSIPFENLGVVWPLGTALTPTAEQPEFRGFTERMECLLVRAWDCESSKQLVEAAVFEARLFDVINSIDLRAGPWSPGYATPTLNRGTFGLGNWHHLEYRLRQALSERFYESQGLEPLSGWAFDSPFEVSIERGEQVDVQHLPTEREEYGALVRTGQQQAVTFEVTLRIAHTLGPVVIRTPRPEHRGLEKDIRVPNPILAMLVELAAS